jgi:SAM-dependent methyltransferase
MRFRSFRPPRLEELYARPYTNEALAWRQLGARDKVHNILQVVGDVCEQIRQVLEVGCGTGAVLNALSRTLGDELVGVDVGPVAREREAPEPRVRFESYDGTRLPFDDQAFDLVYATHVLEHVVDERGFLRELRRVARRFVYLEVPCELHARTSHGALQQSLEIGHINAYTPESFVLTVETSGLAVRKLDVFDHSYAIHRFHAPAPRALLKTVLRRSLLRLHQGLATRLLTYHVGALCEPAPLI